jgi:ribonuclease P protein component
MKKINIVKENKTFNDIINSKNVVKDKNLIIYYKDNDLSKNYRFGISVGKKIGNAVVRNKYKRKLRNIVDNNKKLYANNKDYIIIVRKNCLNISHEEIEKSFVSLINKI